MKLKIRDTDIRFACIFVLCVFIANFVVALANLELRAVNAGGVLFLWCLFIRHFWKNLASKRAA